MTRSPTQKLTSYWPRHVVASLKQTNWRIHDPEVWSKLEQPAPVGRRRGCSALSFPQSVTNQVSEARKWVAILLELLETELSHVSWKESIQRWQQTISPKTGMFRRREGVRERTNRRGCSTNIEFFDYKQQTFGHSGSRNEVLAPTVKMFDFHKQTLLANVLSSLHRFSTPQKAKFVVEMFDPTLRSILESICKTSPFLVSISLKIQF